MRTWTAVLFVVVVVMVVATMAEPEPFGFLRRLGGDNISNNFRGGLVGILGGITGSNPSGFLGGLMNLVRQNSTNTLLTFFGNMAGCRFGESTQTGHDTIIICKIINSWVRRWRKRTFTMALLFIFLKVIYKSTSSK